MSGQPKYDPNSLAEQASPPPSAPGVQLSVYTVLQPPLTRRGSGPGLILILPSPQVLQLASRSQEPLDPEPVQKWAEEGFAVVGITPGVQGATDGTSMIKDLLIQGRQALLELKELDTNDKFGIIVYDATWLQAVSDVISQEAVFVCLTVYGLPSNLAASSKPLLVHVPASSPTGFPSSTSSVTIYRYTAVASPYFVLPQVNEYAPTSSNLAHTRTLTFLRNNLGGPYFDLEAIWEEHTRHEFEELSLAKTMATMVQEPYVNHIPTMTGGTGRSQLSTFYRDHFIFNACSDIEMLPVTRTIGTDRIIDEFIYHFTHDKMVDWLLPGIPPTGKKLSIPLIIVVNVRGDRLCSEHIWWDQASALVQTGLLPTHVPHPSGQGMLRLPILGVEQALMLQGQTNMKFNQMLDPGWASS